MKDKILMLIVGILIGAIVTAACFLLFSNNSNQGMDQMGGRADMGNFIPEDMEGKDLNMMGAKGNRGGTTDNSIETLDEVE